MGLEEMLGFKRDIQYRPEKHTKYFNSGYRCAKHGQKICPFKQPNQIKEWHEGYKFRSTHAKSMVCFDKGYKDGFHCRDKKLSSIPEQFKYSYLNGYEFGEEERKERQAQDEAAKKSLELWKKAEEYRKKHADELRKIYLETKEECIKAIKDYAYECGYDENIEECDFCYYESLYIHLDMCTLTHLSINKYVELETRVNAERDAWKEMGL